MSIPRPPDWLKRLILPGWNGGHHLARRLADYLGAVAARRFERCDCCGTFAPMLYRRRVIPQRLAELWGLSPRLVEALARKESCECAACGAKLRGRRIALTLLDLYPTRIPNNSVAAWVHRPEVQNLRIAEFNPIDGLHDTLTKHPNFSFSDFQDDVSAGVYVNGTRSEDLCSLTYPDASFDLVLTSETLEHVPDLALALAEILRVLVPGGRHVFTVPLMPGFERTFSRSTLEADGTVRHVAPPIRHPGGDVGYPVFTEFGADFPERLRCAGFSVEVRFGPTTEDDLAQVYIAQKPDSMS